MCSFRASRLRVKKFGCKAVVDLGERFHEILFPYLGVIFPYSEIS
jgi:hypothetical protein